MPGPPPGISGLIEADNGALLIAMRGGIRRLVEGKSEEYPLSAGEQPSRLLRDRDGGMWIGTLDRGLVHVHQGRTDRFALSDGLSGNVVYGFFEDREGNVWVATSDGLDRFRDVSVPTISVKQGLSNASVGSVLAARDGSIWLGTRDGLNRWNDGQVTIYRKRSSGLPDDMVGSLFQDDRGRIWVSTYRGVAYFENGRFITVSAVPHGFVHSIAGDSAGNIWISHSVAGLFHLLGGSLVERIPWAKLGTGDHAITLFPDPGRGDLWLGFREGGVRSFKDGQVRVSYASADGLGEGSVNGFQLDRDGTLWAATDGGLSRLKNGRGATLNSKNGLPCDTVHWALEDDDHSFWLYTACGLVRIARAELDAWAADPQRTIQVTFLGSSDGVRSHAATSGYSPRVAKTADGRIWFLPFDGVSVIDPRHIPVNNLPPPVHIEQMFADGKKYDIARGLRLPPRARNLVFDFVALSLVAPEKNRYRFKLEGWDSDWRDAVNELRLEYSNLPPRQYRLRVIASNNSGVWNETGDTLEFSIEPAYYQTTWFYASCVAALLAMLLGLYRLRLYQIRREFNAQLDGRVDERLRVARELHDTLLQSFQASLIRMQVARNMFDRRPEKAVQSLDDAITMAGGAVAEGRSAIQDLRAQPAGGADLAQLLTAAGQELAHSGEAPENPPAFRLTVEGERRDLEPLLQDEVYRIARELLRNAFRHARASRIEAEIRYESRQLRVHIRDDGKGIDPEILKAGGRAGHWGMPGMRERTDRFGGKLEFWSEAGAGTEAVLTLPAAAAYGASNGDPFSFLRRKKAVHERRNEEDPNPHR
jgi:signal transduction histidine kinase